MAGKIMNGLAEIYYKPTTGQVVIRRIGLNTDTEAWKSRTVPKIVTFTEKMTGHSFPTECKGKKWKSFKACLRMKGKQRWAGGR